MATIAGMPRLYPVSFATLGNPVVIFLLRAVSRARPVPAGKAEWFGKSYAYIRLALFQKATIIEPQVIFGQHIKGF
jgi:hypothetical protein